jgi:hypothetical protein
MAANPLIQLGSLNRLRGSVLFDAFPSLDVNAQNMTKEAIKLGIDGDMTQFLAAMAGAVTSPEPWMMFSFSVGIVKTVALAALYKAAWENDTRLGNCSIRLDTAAIPPFDVVNAAIEGVDGLDSGGTNPAFTVRFKSTYYVNNAMWNAA